MQATNNLFYNVATDVDAFISEWNKKKIFIHYKYMSCLGRLLFTINTDQRLAILPQKLVKLPGSYLEFSNLEYEWQTASPPAN